MHQQLMRKLQRSSDSLWSLASGASTTLRVGPGPRILQVCAGRLWLTASGDPDEASIDVWLEAGDGIELPHGLAIVMEAWPSARFQLLVPPCVGRQATHEPPMLARAANWIAQHLHGIGVAGLQPSGH